MDHGRFDALTRRASLTTLSAASLAALAAPLIGEAKKKKRKNKKFDVNKFCKQQVGQCQAAIVVECGDDPECIAASTACCQKLASCDFSGFFVCVESIESPEPTRHFGR